jgi:hypothetical protein
MKRNKIYVKIHDYIRYVEQNSTNLLDELKTNQPNLKDNQMKTTMILIAPRRNPRMLT